MGDSTAESQLGGGGRHVPSVALGPPPGATPEARAPPGCTPGLSQGPTGRPIPTADVPAWSWLSPASPRWPSSQEPQEQRAPW